VTDSIISRGAPPAIPLVLRGRSFARAWEGWGKRISAAPRAFPLGRPGLRMSAAVLLQCRSLVAEATPRKNYWKRGGGLCEGGLRRHVQANDTRTTNHIISTALKTPIDHCEEEPEAGGRIPFSPQIDACPSQRARRRYWRGNAGYLGI